MESQSSHPMADALVRYCRVRGVEAISSLAEGFEILEGEGVRAAVESKTIEIGNSRMARRILENTGLSYLYY